MPKHNAIEPDVLAEAATEALQRGWVLISLRGRQPDVGPSRTRRRAITPTHGPQ